MVYGDTDSQPMYIAYSAFLQEELAQKEAERNIGGEKAYIEARTGIQYMKGYFDVNASEKVSHVLMNN